MLELFDKFGSRPQILLDLACGTGDFTIELARRWPDAEIIGADLTPEMLDIALANRVYDLGYVFESAWGSYVGQIAGKFIDGKTNVASVKPKSFQNQMKKTLSKFDIDY